MFLSETKLKNVDKLDFFQESVSLLYMSFWRVLWIVNNG